MKLLQNLLAVAIVLVVGALVYQYLISNTLDRRVGTTERRVEENGVKIDSLTKDTRTQGEAIQKQGDTIQRQGQTIAEHTETIGVHGRDIAELQKRVAAAEARILELSRASKEDRSEIDRHKADIAKLRSEIDVLLSQNADVERRQLELDDLRKDLKRSIERSSLLEKRLIQIEKQLGIESPQP